jgi:hypothetical protein
MKYLKSINEIYHRTLGFRYSEPGGKFDIHCFFIGDLDSETLQKVLRYNRIKTGELEISNRNEVVRIGDSNIEVSGTVKFQIYTYDDRELDHILQSIVTSLYSDFGIELVNINYKKAKNLSKYK